MDSELMSYADAWFRWSQVIEAGAAPLSARMVELAKVGSALDVLDIGTGIGEPALTAAPVLRHPGRIMAIDPDKKMIAIAKDRAHAQHAQNVDFIVANAETMTLQPQSFDAALARWSLMFVSDLASVLSNIRKSLRSDGCLVAATWATPEQVPALAVAKAAVHRHFHLPGSPHQGVRTFALSDKAVLRSLILEAGFSHVSIEDIPVVYEFSSTAEFIKYRLDVAGSLWSGMESCSPKEEKSAFEAIETALRPHRNSNGDLRLVNQAYCIVGEVRAP
jgi:ubiquinone/menaquinone biosynthesis C-methylase UbiE